MKSKKTTSKRAPASRPRTGRSGHLRARIGELIRGEIMEAAKVLFREKGYRGVSVKEIAARAGTTHTTFYKHFDSKFQLVIEATHAEDPEYIVWCKKLHTIDVKDRKALREWLAGHVAIWEKRQSLYEAYWEALYTDAEIATDLYKHALSLARLMQVDESQAAVDSKKTQEFALILLSFAPIMSMIMRAKFVAPQEELLDTWTSVVMRALSRAEG